MNIQEAVKRAMEQNGFIQNSSSCTKQFTGYVPHYDNG